ncbi:hypothetical protein [Enterobacter roggenkampii]|uniref:hypothetical protein n=1 Tax=Enterobacter roggenkampii TaxID=1812935 RepID=UPI000B3B39E5|nr:hypothetical protein [Enterobacter roggenkampii]OUR38335.1 hypothetical protein B9J96_06605 [Enterobacter roggenkampii]OZU96057.1 hypothetical protein CIW59_16445 [Enterobacter roggenkampii]WFC90190.1 hypothetical protein OM420_16915 [Enterobacter roggenkampii]
MNVDQFRVLCDSVIEIDAPINDNQKDAYDLIKDICKGHSEYISKKSRSLLKLFIFESVFYERELFPYMSILKIIFDASRIDDKKENHQDVSEAIINEIWRQIVEIAYNTRESSSHYQDNSLPGVYSKEFDFSLSCKKLAARGIKFTFLDDDILIDKGSYHIVLEEIDRYIKAIGGINILGLSFQSLAKNYVSFQERFQIFRKTTQGLNQPSPDIPWGYIIALGTKNHSVNGSLNRASTYREFLSFVDYLTDIVCTFEIQPYIMWEDVYVDNLKAVEFLQRNILFDNLISFFQLKSSYAIDLINNISSYWKQDFLSSYKHKLDDIIKIGLSIIELSNPQTISFLSKSSISKRSGLQLKAAENIINDIFTISSNIDLGFPPASEAIDHVLTPLIPHKGSYLTLPKGITSLSVLNCVLNQISKPDGIFNNPKDSSIGNFLEKFVWGKLNAHGIKCYRGDFLSKDKKIKGDCDILIKADDCIYLFEIKKKALTRKAMSGTDIQIIKDLADSLMRSQSQCAKIEYVFLSDKELTLTDDNIETTISYNNERIFKVSLSLHDFGALQDTTILASILRFSMQITFNSSDERVSDMLSNWANYVSIFTDYTLKSRELQPVKDDFFRDNIFMSIPQLLTILDDCHDENQFSDICKRRQHMSYSTRCFYKEYSEHKKLKEYSENKK